MLCCYLALLYHTQHYIKGPGQRTTIGRKPQHTTLETATGTAVLLLLSYLLLLSTSKNYCCCRHETGNIAA